jgi:diguanylate cyclase (GGDEF)-like protein
VPAPSEGRPRAAPHLHIADVDIDLEQQRHAAEVELASAVAARNDAVWLLRQTAALCALAIESHVEAEAALEDATRVHADATTDELTGALRRNSGFVALQHEIDRARREAHPLVLGFLDVDRLKQVNDTEGHPAGDELLVMVVETLRASLRSYDVVMRYGGDEFVYSLAGADVTAAAQRFKTMRMMLLDCAPGRRVSAGFSLLGPDDDIDSLISRADEDLYARRAAERGSA